MKQLWCAMSLMAGSLLFSVNASADTSSGALLQQMNLASQSLNYELSFVSISKQGVESLRYRHARLNNQPLAQLLQLDGPRREVVLRGTEISYFEPGLDPFTLNGDYIVDSLPSLVYSDFKRLSAAYDFISVGRTRIADRLCDVIRVVAPGGTRPRRSSLSRSCSSSASVCRSIYIPWVWGLRPTTIFDETKAIISTR